MPRSISAAALLPRHCCVARNEISHKPINNIMGVLHAAEFRRENNLFITVIRILMMMMSYVRTDILPSIILRVSSPIILQ